MSDTKQKQAKNEKLSLIRHSVSHIMAEAVIQLFPGTKVAIGPSVENGFYYDFQLSKPIVAEDLPRIEEEMKNIIAERQDFVRVVVSREEAKGRFAQEPFKLELIEELPPDAEISIYEQRNAAGETLWADLCRGPHLANTREINSSAFKLQSIAGAYWRGDEHRPMLTRIYGTAWENPQGYVFYRYTGLENFVILEEDGGQGSTMNCLHCGQQTEGITCSHCGYTLRRRK